MYTTALTTVAFATLAAAGPLNLRSDYTVGPFNACSASDRAQTSCVNTTAIQDSCCIETRGGQLLQTQFWDWNPATGPSASWTIHGLWPDRCDSSYEGFCDPSREVTGDQITQIISDIGGHNLLRYMRRYWKDDASVDGNLWSHEFNKHATCFSSGRPQCYSGIPAPGTTPAKGSTNPRKDVFDFFYRTTELFKGLDTYAVLKAGGITPSNTKTYTLDQIQGAIKTAYGVTATVGCINNTLSEMWYHFHVKGGNVYDGEYLPINGGPSTCKATGIRYPPKVNPEA
ncbi:ribonuclease T2-like [Orbilia ellipsospora]|uniref:ribonuclease T2 n=1 Tax=Orbilia ellipsospora TaxID=2528407 RepID=A0AAV9XP57_9PEZI